MNCVVLLLSILLPFCTAPRAIAAVTISSNTLIDCENTTYDSDTVYVVACTLTVDCSHQFEALYLQSGAVLTHSPEQTFGCLINIFNGSLHVDATSSINVDDRGYPAASGPGAGTSANWTACGAGHGGFGGTSEFCQSPGIAYDNLTYPTMPGSGGGTRWNGNVLGGKGGGVVRIAAAFGIYCDGPVSANGGPSVEGGGGSGGSIFLSAPIMHLSRAVTAFGGSALSGGGGGGGRILLYADGMTFQADLDSVLVCGGIGAQAGGAGVLGLILSATDAGSMIVRNCDNVGAITPISGDLAYSIAAGLGARINVSPELNLDDSFVLEDNAGVVTTPLVPIRISARQIAINDLGFISADLSGHPHDSGPGAGVSAVWEGGGAGHGGIGCCPNMGGLDYGNRIEPSSEYGSGGGSATRFGGTGGEGGGAIRLVAREYFLNQGVISANAGVGGARGGGSGGGILISAPTVTGDGPITANGSISTFAGGVGAGGRIAIYTCDLQLDSTLIQVQPGDPGHLPGYGTIYYGTEDLNANGSPDGCDFADGTSTDGNQNSVPDELEVEGNATNLTIDYDGIMHRLMLRWPLLAGYANYQVWAQIGAEPEHLMATVHGGTYDATSLLMLTPDYSVWTFRVIGTP